MNTDQGETTKVRGRPRKYHTEEERKEADRKRHREYYAKKREKEVNDEYAVKLLARYMVHVNLK